MAIANRRFAVMSAARQLLARAMGQQTAYGGDRNYTEVLGYVDVPAFDDYLTRYERQDIAGRIVDLPATDTWKRPPLVSESDKVDTPFVTAWEAMVKRLGVWSCLSRVDRLSGIGRYGVLLIGVKDGGSALSTPLLAGKLKSERAVTYLRPFTEGAAEISTWDWNAQSQRFGMPLLYRVTLGENQADTQVHWTRIIHVAEGKLDSEVYGLPRLQRVLNRLDDLMKLVGGSAEATWLSMRPGTLLSPEAEYTFSGDAEDEKEARLDEVERYAHDPLRLMFLEGVKAQQIGASEVVDPSGLFETAIACIAAATFPQRVLLGSAAGELASAQEDMKQWAGTVASRQTNYAEPEILCPFIDRLIWLGALPSPPNGYDIGTLNSQTDLRSWPSLLEASPLEVADIAEKQAAAARQLANPLTGELPITGTESRELLGYPAQPEGTMENLATNDGLSDYGLGIRAAVRGLWSGRQDKFAFVDGMVSTIQRGLRRAWLDGAKKAGMKEIELTPEELSTLDGIINTEISYVLPFGADIEANDKASGGKLTPQMMRALKWDQRYREVRDRAMMMARSNPKLMWVLGNADHCSSCLKLAGKVKRAKTWEAAELYPNSKKLECVKNANGVPVCKCSFRAVPETNLSAGKLPRI